MEDEHVKPLKTVARRGALITVATACTLVLASCSAGQITQTSNQVAAVDGASANAEDNTIAVRDVTVLVTDAGETGVKFTAINQDTTDTTHTLESVTIGDEKVTISGKASIAPNCNLVADIASEIKKIPEAKDGCITYLTTSATNPGFALGGNQEVTFTFDNTTITTTATVSSPVVTSGEVDRTTGAEAHKHESH
jgi:uncharacterized protein cgl2664/cg2949